MAIKSRDAYMTMILLQVDDGKVVSNCEGDIDELKEAMGHFKTKWSSTTKTFLGAEETWLEKDLLKISSTKQIDDLLETFKEFLSGEGESIPTPVLARYRAVPSMDATGEADKATMGNLPYRSLLGTAAYPARLCHPTMAFIMSELSQHMSNPGPEHWVLLKKCCDFLVSRRDDGLFFRPPEPGTRQLAMVLDANWAGDNITRKSVDNHLIFLYGNVIAWGPKKQPFVSRSTFESELGGVARGGGICKWICSVLMGVGILLELPIPVYMDNLGVMQALNNVTHASSAKHIEIRMFWMKDEVEKGIFELFHVLSELNLADVMTKALPKPLFWKLINDITGLEIITAAGMN
jgi:hypothetical protein